MQAGLGLAEGWTECPNLYLRESFVATESSRRRHTYITLTARGVVKAKNMLTEIEMAQSASSSEISKASKMFNQLAQEQDTPQVKWSMQGKCLKGQSKV